MNLEASLKVGKQVIKLVSGFAVGKAIDNAILAATPNDLSRVNAIATRLGGGIISMFVGDKVGEWVNEKLDEILPDNFFDSFKPVEETDGESETDTDDPTESDGG